VASWKAPGSTSVYVGYRDGNVLEWDFRMPTEPTSTMFCSDHARAPSISPCHAPITSITPVHNGRVVVGTRSALRVYVPADASKREVMDVDAGAGAGGGSAAAGVGGVGGAAARTGSSDSGVGSVGAGGGGGGGSAAAAAVAGSRGSSSSTSNVINNNGGGGGGSRSAGKRPAYRGFDALIDTEGTAAVVSDAEGRFLVAACTTRGNVKVEGARCLGFDLTEIVGLAYPETREAGGDGTTVDQEHAEGVDGMQDHDLGGDLDVGDDGLNFDDSQLSLDLMGDDGGAMLMVPSPTGSDSNWNDFPNLDNLIDEHVSGGDPLMASGHDDFVGGRAGDISPDTDILDFVGLG